MQVGYRNLHLLSYTLTDRVVNNGRPSSVDVVTPSSAMARSTDTDSRMQTV